MRQKLTKMSLKSFYGTHLLLSLGPAPKCGACTLGNTVGKKTCFFFEQISAEDCCWGCGERLCSFPFSTLGAICLRHLNFCLVVSWPCFFWYLPSPAGSYTVCLLCWVLWVLREGIWWRHSTEDWTLQSLSLPVHHFLKYL